MREPHFTCQVNNVNKAPVGTVLCVQVLSTKKTAESDVSSNILLSYKWYSADLYLEKLHSPEGLVGHYLCMHMGRRHLPQSHLRWLATIDCRLVLFTILTMFCSGTFYHTAIPFSWQITFEVCDKKFVQWLIFFKLIFD